MVSEDISVRLYKQEQVVSIITKWCIISVLIEMVRETTWGHNDDELKGTI